MKKTTSCLVSHINAVQSQNSSVINTGAVNKYAYEGTQKTDQIEWVSVTVLAESLGEIQLLFSPNDISADEFNAKFAFAERFSLSDVGTVSDVKIGIYNGSLSIKFYMEV